MPHLSQAEKLRVVTLLEEGWSERMVAARFDIPKSTIHNIKKVWGERLSFERGVGSGRPRVSTEVENANLIQVLQENPFQSAVVAHAETNFPGSVRTARRRIKESILRNHPAVKKPFLTQQNKEQRVGFSLEYIAQPLAFWRNVIFTDEKIFQSCYNGRVRVYRPPNSRFEERYTQKVERSGRFSVNVWGWMSAQGPGVLTNIIGRFNAAAYIGILENVMLPSVNAVFPQNNFIYQQDNCPVHTARTVTNWMQQHNIRVLPWASCSPDINPMENMWGLVVKKMVSGNNFRPQNVEQLWERIQEVWNELTPDYTEALVASVPRRLQNVIEKNGATTKY